MALRPACVAMQQAEAEAEAEAETEADPTPPEPEMTCQAVDLLPKLQVGDSVGHRLHGPGLWQPA